MAKQQKLLKLLAPSVPLVLVVEDHKLELRLAWTMRALVILEGALREAGIALNVLQNPADFWKTLDVTKLTLGTWAMSQQENPEYADADGLDVITSFMTMENYGAAALAMKECFLESLSESRREEIKKAEQVAQTAEVAPTDPTPAPTQT